MSLAPGGVGVGWVYTLREVPHLLDHLARLALLLHTWTVHPRQTKSCMSPYWPPLQPASIVHPYCHSLTHSLTYLDTHPIPLSTSTLYQSSFSDGATSMASCCLKTTRRGEEMKAARLESLLWCHRTLFLVSYYVLASVHAHVVSCLACLGGFFGAQTAHLGLQLSFLGSCLDNLVAKDVY